MSTTIEEFTTEFGDTIKLLPDLEYKIFPNLKGVDIGKWLSGHDNIQNKENIGREHKKIKGIAKDLYDFALMIDLLDELGLIPEKGFKKALDIGGREGIHAALFRGLFAEQSDCADMVDGRVPQLHDTMKHFLTQYKKHKIFEKTIGKRSSLLKLWKTIFPNKLPIRRNQDIFSNIPSFQNFYNYSFKRRLEVDRYLVGDFYETVKEDYDIILSFRTLCLMDHTQWIQKVAQHLKPGGIFAFFVYYRWHEWPVSGLSGNMPYFEQRLTLNDIKRYYEKYKPDQLNLVDTCYKSLDPHFPTVSTYTKVCSENGLLLKGYKRLFKNTIYSFLPITDNDKRIFVEPHEIIKNISRFRKDAQIEDLMTKHLMMVFQKQ